MAKSTVSQSTLLLLAVVLALVLVLVMCQSSTEHQIDYTEGPFVRIRNVLGQQANRLQAAVGDTNQITMENQPMNINTTGPERLDNPTSTVVDKLKKKVLGSEHARTRLQHMHTPHNNSEGLLNEALHGGSAVNY